MQAIQSLGGEIAVLEMGSIFSNSQDIQLLLEALSFVEESDVSAQTRCEAINDLLRRTDLQPQVYNAALESLASIGGEPAVESTLLLLGVDRINFARNYEFGYYWFLSGLPRQDLYHERDLPDSVRSHAFDVLTRLALVDEDAAESLSSIIGVDNVPLDLSRELIDILNEVSYTSGLDVVSYLNSGDINNYVVEIMIANAEAAIEEFVATDNLDQFLTNISVPLSIISGAGSTERASFMDQALFILNRAVPFINDAIANCSEHLSGSNSAMHITTVEAMSLLASIINNSEDQSDLDAAAAIFLELFNSQRSAGVEDQYIVGRSSCISDAALSNISEPMQSQLASLLGRDNVTSSNGRTYLSRYFSMSIGFSAGFQLSLPQLSPPQFELSLSEQMDTE
jgi:hypothetical protein